MMTLAVAGCQPAARYDTPSPRAEKEFGRDEKTAEIPLSPTLTWIDPKYNEPSNPVRIVFVHAETDPVRWLNLKKFWTAPNDPEQLASAIGILPLMPFVGSTVMGPDQQVVLVKVPRGLDDPTPFIPPANPPTLAKWELGRQLFSDNSWLLAQGHVESCAGCHLPAKGFTDGALGHGSFNTPTLVNVVYNSAQFWDGRATYLEEVFARSLEDERATKSTATFRHTWSGAVGRLRDSKTFEERFQKVFGTAPTQDAAGKALATYMRTLLAGNSLHDRALHNLAQRKESGKKKELEAADYLQVLTSADLETLAEKRPKKDVADDLRYGFQLFNSNSGPRALFCAQCHTGRQFTDGQFHNVGLVEESDLIPETPPGRFSHVPVGLRHRELIGAFKTPTLRGLLRTAPYFHNGSKAKLDDALVLHTSGFPYNSYIARALRMGDAWDSEVYQVKLTEDELRALALFLKSLNGEEVDAAVRPQSSP